MGCCCCCCCVRLGALRTAWCCKALEPLALPAWLTPQWQNVCQKHARREGMACAHDAPAPPHAGDAQALPPADPAQTLSHVARHVSAWFGSVGRSVGCLLSKGNPKGTSRGPRAAGTEAHTKEKLFKPWEPAPGLAKLAIVSSMHILGLEQVDIHRRWHTPFGGVRDRARVWPFGMGRHGLNGD